MIDVTSFVIRSIVAKSAWSVPAAFLAGVISSFGPCTAPRLFAVASIVSRKSSRAAAVAVLTFVVGIAAAYVMLTVGGSLIWRIAGLSRYAYAAIAILFAGGGVGVLIRRSECDAKMLPATSSCSAIFLLGASSGMTVAPCCLPILAAAAAFLASVGLPMAVFVSSSYALGHCAPLLLAIFGRRLAKPLSANSCFPRAAQVLNGSLMIAIGGFYGLLA